MQNSNECIIEIYYPLNDHCFHTNDLSIASTKTKYIKLNTKTQNIFCRLNENLTTFLYTLTGATRKQKEKKVLSFKVYTKVECC